MRSPHPAINVLCVDGDPVVLEACRGCLERTGRTSVDTASSAEEALHAVAARRYHVVVSRHDLPGASGIEMLRRIRAQGSMAPFILYAPPGNEEVAIEALNAGVAGYVQMGQGSQRFLERLEEAVRSSACRSWGQRLLDGLNELRGRLIDVGSLDSKLRLISDEALRLLEVGTVRIWMLRPGDFREGGCPFAAPDAVHPCKDRTMCLHLVSESCSGSINVGHFERIPSSMLANEELTGQLSHLSSDDVARDPRLSCLPWPKEARIWLSAYYIRGREGGVMGAIELIRDSPIHEQEEALLAGLAEIASPIMHRGLAEQALKDSEEQLRAVYNGVSEAIVICDLDGRILELNEVASQLTRWPRQDLLGKGIETIAPSHSRNELVSWMKEVDEHAQLQEITLLNRDGKTIILELLARSIHYSGQPSVLLLGRDITERKKMEKELEESQRKLLDSLDLARMAHWDYDGLAGHYTFDDRFYALYGTDREREGGPHLTHQEYVEAFVLPEDRERVDRQMREGLQRGDDTVQLEHRIRRRDGEVRHMVARTTLVRDHEGRLVRSYGINQDVTELKVAEERLRDANKKLRLLSNITSHDIRNQLTILLANIGLAQSSCYEPELSKRLSRMERAVLTIDSHLTFAQEYQEVETTSPTWQDVVSIVERLDVSKELGRLDLGDMDGLFIFADPMLPKVFHNLMENTLKYAASPASARLSAVEADGSLRMIYEDDGPGIPEEDKGRVFQRGYGRGIGLGMFLSSEILAMTGITIAETGMPGQGVRFEMTVPLGHFRWERPGDLKIGRSPDA